MSETSSAKPAGSGNYVVQDGECMNSVASQFGFFWETLWNLPENADLKNVRKNPMVICAGDRVTIPEKRIRWAEKPAEAKHTFRRKGVPAKLRLRLMNEGEPRKSEACQVEIDGIWQTQTTDGDGVLEVPIPPGARRGQVRVGEGEEAATYELNLGHLDPFDTIRGVQQRLKNLGLYAGDVDGQRGEELQEALTLFANNQNLDPQSTPDAQLFTKLKEAHGS